MKETTHILTKRNKDLQICFCMVLIFLADIVMDKGFIAQVLLDLHGGGNRFGVEHILFLFCTGGEDKIWILQQIRRLAYFSHYWQKLMHFDYFCLLPRAEIIGVEASTTPISPSFMYACIHEQFSIMLWILCSLIISEKIRIQH